MKTMECLEQFISELAPSDRVDAMRGLEREIWGALKGWRERESVVKEGLGDREDAVRVAAARLLGSWVDLCEGDLSTFLALFDVRTSTDLTSDALKSVFVTRLEVVDLIKFNGTTSFETFRVIVLMTPFKMNSGPI